MLRYDRIEIHGSGSDPQSAAWERATYDVLQRVFCTHVGAALRAYLATTRQVVEIHPEAANGWPGATPDDYRAAYVAGEIIRWPSDDRSRPGDQTGTIAYGAWGGIGAGTGSKSILGIDVGRLPRARIPWSAEEVLVHELTHSLRHASGVLDNTYIPFDFQTFDEFAAITVQNMFASELRRERRADHSRSLPNRRRDELLWPTEWGTRARIEFERSMIARMHRQMPGFTTRLQLLPSTVCPHNPFVEYFYNPVSRALPVTLPPAPAMSRGWPLPSCVIPPADTETVDRAEPSIG